MLINLHDSVPPLRLQLCALASSFQAPTLVRPLRQTRLAVALQSSLVVLLVTMVVIGPTRSLWDYDIHKAAPPSACAANHSFKMSSCKLLLASLAFHHALAAPVLGRGSTTNYNFAQYGITLPADYELDVRQEHRYTEMQFTSSNAFQIDLRNVSRCDPNFCAGAIDTLDYTYVCGDPRLGPLVLPSCLPLTSLVDGESFYRRFGGLCPGEFLSAWTNYAVPGQTGWFMYPFADGFANTTAGVPIRGRITLKSGMFLDHFGGATGTFVAPARSPYDQRALPPANLDFDAKNGSQFPFNYHVYEVKKPIVVVGGPVTPWFGQPGFGTQFQLPGPISDLVSDGILVEIAIEQKCDRPSMG